MAELTGREQLFVELINRARMDPLGEAARYGLVDLNAGLPPGTISSAPKPVLAPHGLLTDAARAQSQWMLDTDVFSHTGANGTDPGQRMSNAGYVFSGSWSWGENISWSGSTGTFNPNAAVPDQHRGLFLSAGHRSNILSSDFKEIGVGSLTGQFTTATNTYNALMSTHDFTRSGSNTFVTGVSYIDTDQNNFYSIGEGVGGRTFQLLQGASVVGVVNNMAAGGYAIGTTVTGSVELRATGSGLAVDIGVSFVLGSSNVKIDVTDGNTIEANVSATLTRAAQNLELLGIENLAGSGNLLNNVIVGNIGSNLLNGGGGVDSLYGRLGNDTLNGGDQDDALFGEDGLDQLNGDAGNDVLIGGPSADTINGGAGVDSCIGEDGADLINGNADVDLLYGYADNDTLNGGSGGDLLSGGLGNDMLNGDDDGDAVYGEGGDDILNGDNGNDVLVGGSGNDTASGGPGGDTLIGESGNDNLDGGDNDDQLFGYDDLDTLNGGNGNDFLSGGDDNDQLYGDAGSDVLDGDANDDLLNGGADGDNLNGNLGDDTVNGGSGADGLLGWDGADILDGGTGSDYLFGDQPGGAGVRGSDRFVFQDGTGNDAVLDFQGGAGVGDVIDIRGMGFANFAAVQAASSNLNGGVYINLDAGNPGGIAGDALFISNITVAALVADDFLLV